MNHLRPSLRGDIGQRIAERLLSDKSLLTEAFRQPGRIRSFIVDQLLEESFARQIYRAFPEKETMRLRQTFRERKYVAAQMNLYDPLLEETLYAFQDTRVLRAISEITGMRDLLPDEKLYAGGISLMEKGDFLNPHLDNSHDVDRKNYRVLNLLYYVSPDWKEEYGGNLELWDKGPGKIRRTIPSFFNRLVVMITGRDSWHSVSRVTHAAARCCVSNYYFSPHPAEGDEYFHVTSFRGWPQEKGKDFMLRCDNLARHGLRLFFKKGLVKTSHIYRKPK